MTHITPGIFCFTVLSNVSAGCNDSALNVSEASGCQNDAPASSSAVVPCESVYVFISAYFFLVYVL